MDTLSINSASPPPSTAQGIVVTTHCQERESLNVSEITSFGRRFSTFFVHFVSEAWKRSVPYYVGNCLQI